MTDRLPLDDDPEALWTAVNWLRHKRHPLDYSPLVCQGFNLPRGQVCGAYYNVVPFVCMGKGWWLCLRCAEKARTAGAGS